MTDLIKRDDALAAAGVVYGWSIAAAEELEEAIEALPAVTVETCWKCDGSGMAVGDDGDPCICNECKYDGVVPIDPAAIREAALREAYDVVYKWWFGDGNALPQELILALIGGKK